MILNTLSLSFCHSEPPGEESILLFLDSVVFTCKAHHPGVYFIFQMTIEIPYKNQILYFHPAMLIPGFGMVSVAFIFYFFWRKKGISNQYFYWGALTWIIGIALKIAASGLTIKPITALLNTLFPQFLSKSLGWLVVGLYTGIFECIPIYLILRMQRFKKITWSQSVGFGIGFGAIEALLIGIFSLGTISMLLAPEMLPQELAKGFMDFQGINIKTIIALLLPISERLFTVFIHILSCLWIVVAILRGNIKWFLFSFLYKTAIDSIAAFSYEWGLNIDWHVWTIEFIVVIFGLFGLFMTKNLKAKFVY